MKITHKASVLALQHLSNYHKADMSFFTYLVFILAAGGLRSVVWRLNFGET